MRLWRFFFLLTFTGASLNGQGQALNTIQEAVTAARSNGFLHRAIYERANEAAHEMAGNRLLDPMEFEFLRGEFNGPYPNDFQSLAKQNFGNGFDQIYLSKWNKSRRESIEAQMNLELARADVAVEQAYLEWQASLFLNQWLQSKRPQADSSPSDWQAVEEKWQWTQYQMEVQSRYDQALQNLQFLTGYTKIEESNMAVPLPLLRLSFEAEAADFSLISVRNQSALDVEKWKKKYDGSQKLPDVWLGYYQLTIEDQYGFDGMLIQLDIPWASWFEQSVRPIAPSSNQDADLESFEKDQRKVSLVAQFERYENEWLPAALELKKSADQIGTPLEQQFLFTRDYVNVVLSYNKALYEWKLIQQL